MTQKQKNDFKNTIFTKKTNFQNQIFGNFFLPPGMKKLEFSPVPPLQCCGVEKKLVRENDNFAQH